ncbi:MAG: DUF2294 domain-containing protein [Solirubrobacterales bacterium]
MSESAVSTPDHAEAGSSLTREIARAMVALFKEYTGRGPTQARAYVEGDAITVVLQDTMTTAEKTLAAENEEELVRQVRRVFQGKFREDAIEIAERLTGRRVKAFLSDHAIDPDVAVEVFVLEAAAEDS